MKKYNCDICTVYTFCDKHHIISKSKGGSNKIYNQTIICPNCHRKVHLGEIIIEGKFLTTSGFKLLWHYEDEENISERKQAVHIFGK
jgi:hypothetical protein